MKRLGIRIPITLWDKLKEIAEYRGYTMNKLIIDACWKYAESEELDR